MNKITPCLWFDGNAEEAAMFYVALFPDAASIPCVAPRATTRPARQATS